MKTRSLLRREEYKKLKRLTLEGKILDVGGSTRSGYHELIGGAHTFVTGNIDASYGADVIFDAQEVWPFSDSEFSAVLFINVLEHVYEYQNAIMQAHRVLEPGGAVVGVVPFMFNIHGSPSDYFRYTRFSLQELLERAGFVDIEIAELGTGAFSVIYHNLIGLVRWQWLANLLIPMATGLDGLISALKPNNKASAAFMPLGYYFKAHRS